MLDILLVAAGGFVGATARFFLTTLFARWLGAAFPYGTVFINITGSFILSLFLALVSRGWLIDEAWRWLIAVGFCGGYTTFSTYSYESLMLLREGKIIPALLFNHFGSYALGMLAALAGWLLGSAF